jgi:glycosyltransferase involved in cell wall biosynthesis
MRILLVHEYYRQRGGEDVAFETDGALLEAAGHEVARLTFHNTEIADKRSPVDALKLFATTVWSREAAAKVDRAITQHRPDVAHFHNVFPLGSPAAFNAAAKRGVPVLATLHNYRLICPNASLYRDSRVCEDCVRKPLALPGLLHACYRDSHSQSAAVVAMLAFHKLRRTWSRDVTTFIAPSEFLRRKVIEGGLPAGKVRVRPNAVAAPPKSPPGEARGFLYVGRLTQNKGVPTLLRAWQQEGTLPPLRIVGTGELEEMARDAALTTDTIEYSGPLPHDEVFRAMSRARALLFPSTWYENQPLTILEAFASGVPVIASRLGALPELVRDGETGLLFAPGDAADLAAKVRWATENAAAMRGMGEKALKLYRAEYSPEASIEKLVSLYEEARRIAARQVP